MSLSEQHCKPCEGGVRPYSAAEARAKMTELARDWQLDATGTALIREYRFKNFFRTMSFVNAVAHVANVEDHHPDLTVGYDRCQIRYSTHAISGLSENDFICAAKIDRLP
jgi:4a-hydroxytetrahydrobiopterin dehydratase